MTEVAHYYRNGLLHCSYVITGSEKLREMVWWLGERGADVRVVWRCD